MKLLELIERDGIPIINTDNDCDVRALIIGSQNIYELEAEECFPIIYPRNQYMAIGSGAPYARSAMKLDLTAQQAVVHASKFDAYTGGEIKWFSL